ncbi:hypothetical protein Nepgr_033515 [Nepenthes gracilis]|uniref:Uncharacterized protein n=1 Tax=Nepenthes gracilis TaxID=150966 RepID=A0AAD3TM52_NEPGR|nr:hypothetical protein Nepgr_033515 [Nepenthes gracilis]
MRFEVPGETVPCLDQPELGSVTDGVCVEAPVCRVVLDSDLKPLNKAPNKMAPCSGCSHPAVNCSSKLAPVAAEVVQVVAGPKMAPCPIGNDRVGKENAPLVNMPQINLCPQGGLGEDGKSPVPLVVQDPASSVLTKNHQLDDRHPADAESIESLATRFFSSPHAAPVDQHGKAPGSAQLALIFHQ